MKTEITELDRETFYHRGATHEIMEIIRRRNNSPETRRLIDQRNQLSRPGTLRRRFDHYTQRTVLAPSRPNKKSREEIAEINAKLMSQSTGRRIPTNKRRTRPTGRNTGRSRVEIENAEIEEDSVIMRGDNLPIVDLSNYNTEGKEAKYIQINHLWGN